VAFAQSLGFLPHRDFRKARKALNGIDAAAATRTFTFGEDGRVHFVAGPDDDETRISRVLAVLNARFGPEGYDFTPYGDADDEDEFYEDALDMMFRYFDSAESPEHVRNGFQVSGFVAGAVVLDPATDADGWWRALFGGDVPELPENEEFDAETIHIGFVEEWLRAENEFAEGRFEPALPEVDEPPGDHFVIAADYCRGFLQALEARPEQSARLEQDAQAAEALATLRRYAGGMAEGPSATARRSAAPVIGAALRTLWDVTGSWRAPPVNGEVQIRHPSPSRGSRLRAGNWPTGSYIMSLLERARAFVDAAHAADPARLPDGRAAELVYADRMEAAILRLDPVAPPLLRLAARCQHLERWSVPRDTFPMDRAGYHQWRRSLYTRQADRARALLTQAGVGEDEASEVALWVSKTGLMKNDGTQTLEDAACLVFLEHELADFAAKHADYTREKFVEIIRKTWRKMSPRARELGLALPLPEALAEMVREAVAIGP
jgi:tRNAThr (cytosine32-N3)-methyltransferase